MKFLNGKEIPNLTYIKSFHSVAKHGSLGAAASADGGSVPTLSRHIAALEEKYGILLFDRRGEGLSLTQTGTELFDHAQAVRNAGLDFHAAAAGNIHNVNGVVRISASRPFAYFLLPEILTALGRQHPEINIDLIATDLTSNLIMREADIAIRMFRPTQASLYAKQIGEIKLGAYASPSYLDRKGVPRTFEDLRNHDIIGDDSSDQVNRELENMGIAVSDDFFRYRCNEPTVAWQLVLAGAGIGLAYTSYARHEAGVVRVLEQAPEIILPIWLTSHAELKTSSRIRVVFDFLATETKAALLT